VAVIDQINTRVDPAMKARYDAAAAALDQPASSIFREILEKALPEIEKRAEERAHQRGGWPGTIPAHAVEQALQGYMRAVARSDTLRLAPHDIYGPEGKALFVLLAWIWSEETADDAKARKKLAAWLESLNIKAEVSAAAAHAKPALPDSRPVKNYPRREN
jgi:hypothetical protein